MVVLKRGKKSCLTHDPGQTGGPQQTPTPGVCGWPSPRVPQPNTTQSARGNQSAPPLSTPRFILRAADGRPTPVAGAPPRSQSSAARQWARKARYTCQNVSHRPSCRAARRQGGRPKGNGRPGPSLKENNMLYLKTWQK